MPEEHEHADAEGAGAPAPPGGAEAALFRPPPGLSLPPGADAQADHAAGQAKPPGHLSASAPAFLPSEAAQWLGAGVEAREEAAADGAPPAADAPGPAAEGRGGAGGGDGAGAAAAAGGGGGGGGGDGPGHADAASQLPSFHRSLLRGSFQDVRSGSSVPYYVGRLKSFGQQKGYGFLECSKAHADWGADVFIHKKLLPQPWSLGQFVEFAIVKNGRGQPQATDVRWLPHVESTVAGTSIKSNAGAGDGVAANPSTGAEVARAHGNLEGSDTNVGSGTAVEPSTPGTLTSPQSEEGDLGVARLEDMRYLGTMKSFSPAQGYGFIASTELQTQFSRDIYFQRSQLPTARWVVGQTVEFAVALNARGQPQARKIDWDPVPMLPPLGSASPPPRDHEAQVLEWLGRLLREIHAGEAAAAVVRAVNLQGQTKDAAAAAAVDYVTFVLDRLPSPEAVARGIADSVQLLLLLLISRILRRPDRRRLVSWFDALSRSINPLKVEDHFHQTVSEIARHSTATVMSQMVSQDRAAYEVFRLAVQNLQAKCRQVLCQDGKGS